MDALIIVPDGQRRQTLPEDEKIERAVAYINDSVLGAGLELARQISEYVLNEFFDGDYARFVDPSRTKPASFRKLCRHANLAIGGHRLYTYVRIGQQLKRLPEDVAERLSVTHHRALLPLKSDKERLELAVRAADEEWTGTQLESEVRSRLPPSTKGRKPLPVAVKVIRRVSKELGSVGDSVAACNGLPRLGAEEREVLVQEIERSLEVLKELRDSVENTDMPADAGA